MSSTDKDTRNMHWRTNNVGSQLLARMGWKEGQGVGKRRRTNEDTTSEGIRIKRRAEGLGLGASSAVVNCSTNNNHVEDFGSLLEALKSEHTNNKTKSKRKKSVVVSMPTNRLTHQRVRQAKFEKKTAQDMKCIFGATTTITEETTEVTTIQDNTQVVTTKIVKKVKESKSEKKSKKKRQRED